MAPGCLPESRFDTIPSRPPRVLLIGCGAVGSVVAQHLVRSDAIAGVIVADLDGELAKRTAAAIGIGEVAATQLDAGDDAALRASDGMDRLESVKVRDGDTASSPEYPFIALFSPETFVEETLSPSRIWREGKYESVPPFGEPETYEFPAPVGPLTVYSVDHEEVDTLPRFLGKGVRYVDFKLALDATTVQTLKLFRDLRLLEPGPPGGPSPRRALFAALTKPADLAGRVDGQAVVLVEVTGMKDEERVVRTVYAGLDHREAAERFGATATAYLTGSGAAAGAILLADGTIGERGKLSPENLDPKPFFPLLRRFGIEVKERIRRERSLS